MGKRGGSPRNQPPGTTIAEELNFAHAAYAYKQAVDHFSIKSSSENLAAMVDECFK